MAEIVNLNNVSVCIDGSTYISKDDIVSIDQPNLGIEPLSEKTFGKPQQAIPLPEARTFSITVRSVGMANRILASLMNEYNSRPKYHTITTFDGGNTTIEYKDVLVYDLSNPISVDSIPNVTYSMTFLYATISTGNNEEE